jgi:hypothetical protein
VQHNVVAGRGELLVWKLVLATFDFLHAYDVNIFTNEVVNDSLHSGAN